MIGSRSLVSCLLALTTALGGITISSGAHAVAFQRTFTLAGAFNLSANFAAIEYHYGFTGIAFDPSLANSTIDITSVQIMFDAANSGTTIDFDVQAFVGDVTPTPLPVGQIVNHTHPTSYTDGISVPVEFHYASDGGNDSMSYHFSGAYDFTTLLATASPFPPNINLRDTHATTFRTTDGLRVQGFFWTGDYNDVDLNISNVAVVISGNAIPCGNRIVEGGEQCDEGADNGTEGSCCLQDCTLRPQGSVCRPLQDSQCDLEEVCNGVQGSCPADRVASSDTPCELQDPCTIKDHCDEGVCVGGIEVCSAVAEQPKGCVQPLDGRCFRFRRPARIDIAARVNRDLLAGAASGGKLSAVAFRTALSPTLSPVGSRQTPVAVLSMNQSYLCTPSTRGDVDCIALHRGDLRVGEAQGVKLRRDGSAIAHLNLNPLSRRLLREAGILEADVCVTLRFHTVDIRLRCSAIVAAH